MHKYRCFAQCPPWQPRALRAVSVIHTLRKWEIANELLKSEVVYVLCVTSELANNNKTFPQKCYSCGLSIATVQW